MIQYSGSPCSFARWHGSVAPKALRWTLPCVFMAFIYIKTLERAGYRGDDEPHPPSSVETTGYGLYTSILGFLIVFRAQLAYGRYWEGITQVERACGVWLNGVSNLIAFCSDSPDKQVEVATFQHLLSRLMSILLSISLCEVSRLESSHFPILSVDGINTESLEFLAETTSKPKVVLQWVQRLIVENARAGAIDIAPPILSRVFQELSMGSVNLIDAQKITLVPFPFQFAQMVWIMLVIFITFLVPMTCALYLVELKAYFMTFTVVFVFMSVHYISVEIEQPFGKGPNHLPLEDINRTFNRALLTLLESEAQQTPVLVKTTDGIRKHVLTCQRIATERISVASSGGISQSLFSMSESSGSSHKRAPIFSKGAWALIFGDEAISSKGSKGSRGQTEDPMGLVVLSEALQDRSLAKRKQQERRRRRREEEGDGDGEGEGEGDGDRHRSREEVWSSETSSAKLRWTPAATEDLPTESPGTSQGVPFLPVEEDGEPAQPLPPRQRGGDLVASQPASSSMHPPLEQDDIRFPLELKEQRKHQQQEKQQEKPQSQPQPKPPGQRSIRGRFGLGGSKPQNQFPLCSPSAAGSGEKGEADEALSIGGGALDGGGRSSSDRGSAPPTIDPQRQAASAAGLSREAAPPALPLAPPAVLRPPPPAMAPSARRISPPPETVLLDEVKRTTEELLRTSI